MDKYLWLEEVLDEKALNWARKQNERTFTTLTKTPTFENTVNELTEILSSKDKIILPYAINDGFVYNYWSDDKNIQGLLKRTTIEDYRNEPSTWETVIDFDELSRLDGEKWVLHGFEFSPDNKRALVFLSPGGSDADIMREFDMGTKTFVKDGFTLPISKGSAAWLSNDELFLERDFGAETVTASGYANSLRRWKRGEKLEDSKIIFTIPKEENAVSISTFHYNGQSRFIIYRRNDFYSGQTYIYENDVVTELALPKKIDTDFNLSSMFILLREDWKEFKSGDYVAYDFKSQKTELIFSAEGKKSIAGTGLTRDGVVLIVDEDVTSSLYYFSKKEAKWESTKLDLPRNGSLDYLTTSRSLNTFYVGYDSLNIPLSYFECEGVLVKSIVKKQKAFFHYEDIEVSQYFATSLDGTKVPYFLAHKKGLVLNGKNPTILYGYGGFEISLKAHFSNLLGAAWLAKGGVYVLSNIRGGGEYGPEWHQCALKANRDRAYQDFFAIAEELIAKKITSREHLAAWGGSNGGLLMGVCYTQRPDLFAAINCAVPLLDMQRYHKLLAGYSWIAEYGNPDDEEDGRYIRALSPYQRVKKDEKNYPMMYLNTSTKDDRVHPGHARKFAAILEEYGHPYFYYENIEGGHAGASNLKELAFNKALDYEFFWKYLK